MMYLFMYDIADAGRRVSVAEVLEEWGCRLQYSVFRCQMGRMEFEMVWQQLVAMVNGEEESLRCYPVCSDCMEQMYRLGKGDSDESGRGYLIL